jgi:phage tail-like protein
MAQSVSYQKVSYPLPLYNFRVTVGSTAISFVEVSGISVDYDHVTYRHGLSYLEGEDIQTFNLNPFIKISCQRGTILNAKPTFLYDWLSSRDLRSMEISLCDEQGQAVFSWKIAAAVPVSLKAPTFSANSTEVAIDTLEIQARGVTVAKES